MSSRAVQERWPSTRVGERRSVGAVEEVNPSNDPTRLIEEAWASHHWYWGLGVRPRCRVKGEGGEVEGKSRTWQKRAASGSSVCGFWAGQAQTLVEVPDQTEWKEGDRKVVPGLAEPPRALMSSCAVEMRGGT